MRQQKTNTKKKEQNKASTFSLQTNWFYPLTGAAFMYILRGWTYLIRLVAVQQWKKWYFLLLLCEHKDTLWEAGWFSQLFWTLVLVLTLTRHMLIIILLQTPKVTFLDTSVALYTFFVTENKKKIRRIWFFCPGNKTKLESEFFCLVIALD